ncbi:probable DEAD-box ATP-dependent RNA helicase 48 isoform X3 [Populus trichocarpa]|uniref:probable DEAD-box ATP-dependent RNA helicase 48 isoform X3 n=1 Tax=Populus trichocarpa TaxID=3694 RepID=UPI002279B366|nr:probable DEAD-box ATP-dependent RNA helicase 48 isoform X3 [Populus trichocarpa]
MYPSLLRRSKFLSEQLRTRVVIRLMGGGPLSFPGGLNKWQWKRLHEKKAKEKEKRLLDQEKQLFQDRMRSQIRSNLAGQSHPNLNPDPNKYNPMSPNEHLKALADRFMKDGAEDLWNENDGSLKPPSDEQTEFVGTNQQPGSIHSPVDLRKLISEGRHVSQNRENGFNFVKSRDYSMLRDLGFESGGDSTKPLARRQRKFRINESSSSVDDEDHGFVNDKVKNFVGDSWNERGGVSNLRNVSDFMKNRGSETVKQRRFQRNESDDEDEDLEGGGDRRGRSATDIGSRAALGKYDMKKTRRVPLKELDKNDFANEVELIRYELGRKKKFAGNEGDKEEEDSILSEKRFDECGLSPLTVKALIAAGYVQMTRVQEATLSVCLEAGKDAMVKAKTGTGKSAAFLLPAIEAVLKATSSNDKPQVSPIYALILCPTRELASQIAAEANAMLKYHDGIGVLTLVGGTRFKDDQRRLESDPYQIIVATPGRLLDHIENKGGLSVHLMGLKVLILDEADHLLDLGFRKDMEKILDCLPRQRQSLLFSATIPKEIKQSFLVSPHRLHFQVVHHLLKEHILQAPDYKVIVFCTTGMVTSLMYLLLREMNMNVREMHSRKPQLYRTRVSNEFRESKRLILVTSDVSARGMNYPDVTLVIQVGIPYDREHYIHRLGRTGREGKDGEGILLLAPWEEYFLNELKDLPLEKFPLPQIDSETNFKMEESMSKIDSSVKEGAYHAWLGYYNSIREIGRDKTTLVELANQFSESIGLHKPPSLFRKTALKMGLKDIPGIRIRR